MKLQTALDDMLISNGYVGEMGVSFHTPTADELAEAIAGAMKIESKTQQEIIDLLDAGKAVRWCESWNFYYDHNYGKLGRRKLSAPPVMVRCDCGHEVPRGQVMSASLGTSCPDCYDRMSD